MDCKRFRNAIFVKILSLLIAVSFLFTSLDVAPLFAQPQNNPYLYKLSAPPIWRLLAEFRYAAKYLYKSYLTGKKIKLDEINSTLERLFEKKKIILEKEPWAEDALKYGGLEVMDYGWHGDPALKELEIIFKFKNNSEKVFRAVYSGEEFKEVEKISSPQIKADSAKVKLPEPSEVSPKKQAETWISQEEATGKLDALPTIGSIERLTEFYKEVERKHLSYKEIFEHLKPELAKMVETLRSARQVDELNKLLEQKELNIQVKQLDILRAVNELILQFLPDKKGVDNITRLKEIKNVFVKHPDISKLLIDYFETRFDPNKTLGERGEDSGNIRIEILDRLEKISGNFNEYSILYLAQAIFVATVKTNYYIDDRISLFLRLIPRALVLQDRSKALIRTTPFAIIWVHVPYGAYGAHSRYADIARGGLRSLRPDRAYLRNKVLSECTALSFIQHNKHIDIPEGGSKGTFIYEEGLNPIAAAIGYVDGLIGSMMSSEGAAADIQYHPVDPLELGPDEGTADLGSLFTVYGWMKGLEDWRLLMTGKSEALFGVSHMANNLLVPARKGNRVTSQGVMVHAIEMVRYLRDIGKIKSKDTEPVKFSVTGGMRGDVTSGIVEGAIYHYKDNAKILTLGDSSAVISDPEGLDNGTLLKMYDEKAQAKKFPREKLHKGGFVVEVKEGGAEDSYVELGPETLEHMNTRALDPDELERLGADIRFREQAKLKSNEPLVEVLERDEKGHPKRVRVHSAYLRDVIFFLVKSDMLLTGGGIKDSIDDKNWQLFFDWDGSPIAPGIVHGANVFISRIANNELESRGVIIEPDKDANSLGVEISSRMEIDFNILFDIEEIKHELMAAYFEQVISKSLENAKEKFWALRIEAEDNPGKHIITNISPRMSEDIIRLADLIKGSHLVADRKEGYADTVLSYLKDYFPDVSRLDPGRYKRTLDRVFDHMPSERIKAIVSKVIAKEVLLNLGIGAVSHIAKLARKSELEIIEKYLKAAQELNINDEAKKILDNKDNLSPREQISRLRALREKAIMAIIPHIEGGAPTAEWPSGMMPRGDEQDVHKWWREAGFTEEEISDLGEKWDETWREVGGDTKKFKEIERELKEHNIIIKKLAELSLTENPLFASYQSLTNVTARRFKSDEPYPFTEAEGSLLTDTDKTKLINSRKEYLNDPKFEHLLSPTRLYAKLHDKLSHSHTPPSSEIRTILTKDNADQFIEMMQNKLENVESELIQKNVWIIMKGKFELDYRGNDAATEKYKKMIQNLRTIEGNGGNVTFVKDKVSMINVMKSKIFDDHKVVVIDDNPEESLTTEDLSGLEKFKNQYAVIKAEVRRELEADEFQYFNIKAMVALGLAMMDEGKDEGRIKELYNLLTGEDITDDKWKDIKASNIVRLLPRIVKFSGELDTYTIIRKLVDIAA